MRIKVTLSICLLALVMSASVAAAGGSGSANDKPKPSASPGKPPTSGWAVHPGGEMTPMASSGPIEAFGCTYSQEVDNAHISSDPPTAASSHGWWLYISGGCPSTANVDTYLQALWWTGYVYEWRTVAFNSGDVYAGGGAGNRITARLNCAAFYLVSWRSLVDVDLTNHLDPPGLTESPYQNLNCAPPG